ncbi:hypothetical protein SOVF_153620 [Spinacia oleracea]|nr:hypothetical protein SOVF_153620 [Spinacia oleracea]
MKKRGRSTRYPLPPATVDGRDHRLPLLRRSHQLSSWSPPASATRREKQWGWESGSGAGLR